MSQSSQNIQYKAGEAKGHAQATTDHMMDKASNCAQSAKESCQESKEQAGSFLQQTGEQAKNMAQGAADAVKSSLGIGDKKN